MSDPKQEFIDELMKYVDEYVESERAKPTLIAFLQEHIGEPVKVNGIGKWLSAALDDPYVCAEMKADIECWFEIVSKQLYRLDGGKK